MANEFKTTAPTGATIYAVLLNVAGQMYRADSAVFEAIVGANWVAGKYPLPMAQVSTTQIYLGNMPTGPNVPAGRYSYVMLQQAGAAPAVTDTIIAQGAIEWTGAAIESVAIGNHIVDGSFTKAQLDAIATAMLFEATRTWTASTHTAVATWYRRLPGSNTEDMTRPVVVKTTVYDSSNSQIVSSSVAFSNLP